MTIIPPDTRIALVLMPLGGVVSSLSDYTLFFVERMSAISASDWLVALIVFAAVLLVVDLVVGAVRRIWYATKFETVALKIKEGGEPGVARLTTSKRKSLELDLGSKVRIWSVAGSPPRRFGQVDATLWGRNDGGEALALDEIELSKEMLQKLFPRGYDPDKAHEFEISTVVLEGIWLYWFDPNPSQQFQNRFAVYLSTFLTGLSLLIGFAPLFFVR